MAQIHIWVEIAEILGDFTAGRNFSLTRGNTLAKGALLAAAMEKCAIATAEHVRLASTEIM